MKQQTIKKIMPGANFSVVLPGPCNAQCCFCFWKRSENEAKNYTEILNNYLNRLGSAVTQISITGGEPTLSPHFEPVIGLLRQKHSDKKIVLTTNGAQIVRSASLIAGVVDHVNLSMHGESESQNKAIFRFHGDLVMEHPRNIADRLNKAGIDLTFNKVVPYTYAETANFYNYLDMCRDLGGSAVCIRSDYNVNRLEPTPVEKELAETHTGKTSGCPVCVTTTYVVKGMPVHFRRSLQETSGYADHIHELVLHPDGRLCEDWAGKKEVEFADTRHSLITSEEISLYHGCTAGGGTSGC